MHYSTQSNFNIIHPAKSIVKIFVNLGVYAVLLFTNLSNYTYPTSTFLLTRNDVVNNSSNRRNFFFVFVSKQSIIREYSKRRKMLLDKLFIFSKLFFTNQIRKHSLEVHNNDHPSIRFIDEFN